jgi:hypothetical protein
VPLPYFQWGLKENYFLVTDTIWVSCPWHHLKGLRWAIEAGAQWTAHQQLRSTTASHAASTSTVTPTTMHTSTAALVIARQQEGTLQDK